jgi:hypothetical protein
MNENDIIAMTEAAVALGAVALLLWRPRAFLPAVGAAALLWIVALVVIGGDDWRRHAEYLVFFLVLALAGCVAIWLYDARCRRLERRAREPARDRTRHR